MTPEPFLIDDCFLHDKDRLRHDEALELLQTRLAPITGTEVIPCSDALGRILGEDIHAPHAVPLHTNAAVDGYAFSHNDLGSSPLPVSNRIAAGDLSPPQLTRGTAVRIFTGAPMPDGSDTVAMQEDCTLNKDIVELPRGLKQGANCRLSGEDLQKNDVVLNSATVLKAADLAAVASVGLSEVLVCKRLKIALFSSGNEMRIPGASKDQLQPGEVYDANQPLLFSLCKNIPVDLTLGGIIPDDADAVQNAISDASKAHDVIITTGGASRGAEDHMLAVLDELGKRHLWQLAVKPGRPMMFGQIPRAETKTDCLFFGLPEIRLPRWFAFYSTPALHY